MYVTTFINSDGNRVEQETLIYYYNNELNNYCKDNNLITPKSIKEEILIEIGISTWNEIKKLGITPIFSHFLFDKNINRDNAIGEVITLHCYPSIISNYYQKID